MMSVKPAPHPSAHQPGHADLDAMLDAMLARPQDAPAIAAEIEARYGETRAVLVLDMSGFMRLTQALGIITFLTMIRRMRRIALPVVARHSGALVKAEADNLLCLFDSPAPAVAAARDIMALLEADNRHWAAQQRIAVAVGIGYGAILNVDGRDLFGAEVNLASKLGEDTARAGEILLTPNAMAALAVEGLSARAVEIEISGAMVAYFAVLPTG